MKKYLVVGVSLRSRGGEAMVFETCRRIKENNLENVISIATFKPDYDLNFLKRVGNPYGITVFDIRDRKYFKNRYINMLIRISRFLYDVLSALLNSKLPKYSGLKIGYKSNFSRCISESDIILEIAGISFSENAGRSAALKNFHRMLQSKIMGKKYFCLPQAYGPSNDKFINIVAKIGLNCVTHIMPRGEQSLGYLKKLHLKHQNITFVPDLAFSYIDPTGIDDEKIRRRFDIDVSQKHIGVIFNVKLYKWCGIGIVKMLSHAIDYLSNTLEYKVIMMAHELNEDNSIDDRFVNDLIYENCTNKADILNISEDLRANEIKSLIRLCNLTLCSRFHGMISSLKMNVPPIIIGWANKYYEVMAFFNLENLVVDFRNVDENEIIDKVKCVQTNNSEIINRISKNLKEVTNSSGIMKQIIETDLH